MFFNLSCSSYSKSILYINYHPYFIIFHTTNFFSLIPISITFHSFNFNVYLEFYLHLINIICELQFIKITNSFTFFPFPFFFFFPSLFLLPSISVSPHPFVSSLSSLSLPLDLLDAAPATAVAEPVVVVFIGERFELWEAGEGARLRARGGSGKGRRLSSRRGFGRRRRVAWGVIGRCSGWRGGATRLRRYTTPSEAARGAWQPRHHDRRLGRVAGETTRRQLEATVTAGRSSSWHDGERAIAVPHRGSVSSAILTVSL
jgi:hypothetical protein